MLLSLHLPTCLSLLLWTLLEFPLSLPAEYIDIDPPSQDALNAEELIKKSDAVLQSFLAAPNMERFRNNINKASGVFIVPQMLRGKFLIGRSGGAGLLLARDPDTGTWRHPAFYTLDSVSTGLQIGADASEIILLVMTEKGMKAMLSPEFNITGQDVSVAAGSVGDEHSRPSADILAFTRSMKGIFGGVFLAGAVITPRPQWNKAYYGKPVTVQDILMQHAAGSRRADLLRSRLRDVQSSLESRRK
ncbi:MAG: lipid-binding SYLF domain-containing protein [Candidatus Electrothrix sp. YB6]